MSTLLELKEAIEKVAKLNHDFRDAHASELKSLAEKAETRATELTQKVDRFNTDLTAAIKARDTLEAEIKLQRERIEELESRQKGPGKDPQEKRRDEHKSAFEAWIRQPSPDTEQQLKSHERKLAEFKDITVGTGAQGGFAVPEEIAREIGKLELLMSPVRSLVKVVPVGSADYKELVSKRGATSGWVGETGTRTATLTPQLRERAPTFGEIYAYPQASEWSLDDIFFNVEQWLASEVADDFAQEEGTAVISGNGTSKPTGLINTAPVTTADFASPERSANAFQYINSDLTPGGSGLLADALIDTIYTLHSTYRARATWIFNSLTAAAIRKLKDSQNQYLWAPGLQAGQPDRLLGYGMSVWEQMPNIGAGLFPVAFGDWKRAYVLADRVGLRITRDNVTNVGFVRFYVRRREGGHVLDNHAAKFIRTE